MPIQDHLDKLAKQVATTDLSQSGQIVELQTEISKFKAELTPEHPSRLSDALDRATQLTTALLWSESTDFLAAGSTLGQLVSYIQDVLENLEYGGSPDAIQEPAGLFDAPPAASQPEPSADAPATSTSIPAPDPAAAEDEDIDMELLGMFVGSCLDSLSGIEHQILSMKDCPDPAESVNEIKRVMHTIKGECGVLSLETAQDLCHLAEDLILELPEGAPFPESAILALADWLVTYVNLLAEDPRSGAPDSTALRADLVSISAQIEAGTYGQAAGAQPAVTAQAPAPAPTVATAPAQDTEEESGDFALLPDSGGQRVQIEDEILADDMLPDILTEMRQHLEYAEAAMLELGEAGDGREHIDVIFRAFHTIKGIAGFMHMQPIVLVAHKAETMMDDFRKEIQVLTPTHTNLLFKSRDVMGTLLDALEGEEGPLISTVNEITINLGAATVGDDDSKKAPAAQAAPMAAVAPAPVAEPVVAEPVVAEPVVAEPVAAEPEAPKATTEPEAAAATKEIAPAPRQESAATEPKASAKLKPKAKTKIERTVKVATGRLDVLIDMVGELVIAQQMVSQHPAITSLQNERLERDMSQVNKITRDLQESAMSLRMVPLRSTFQKMARLVRDVAIKSGKTVNLELVGEDAELDRNVVEEIGDPMIHLIRNAVDHGMETPEEREAIGKPAAGTLQLRAHHQGGSILIEIQDNGKGLDRQGIFNKSLERGLIPANSRIEDIADSELWQKIFLPGFSTAAAVTSISGRGVGLDVVKRKIEGLRGKIEIESKKGVGTTFTMRLPLTLAIIDGMIIRIGSRRFVIPTLAIEQSFQPTADQVSTIFERGELVNVRGASLPVMRLKQMLDLEEGTDSLQEGILLLVETNSGRVCLLVDEILGQQQVVIKSITKALPGTHGLSGAAILGDGVVALIIDTDSLVADRIEALL